MPAGDQPTRQELADAFRAMLEMHVFSELRADLETALILVERARADASACVLDDIIPEKAAQALRLHLGGYVAGAPARTAIEAPRETQEVPKGPDDTGGLAKLAHPTELPELAELAAMIAHGATLSAGSSGAVTFLFLADPQISRDEPHDNDAPRVKMCSQLNTVLNTIETQVWPSGFGIDPSLVGTPIGKPAATFFGGDLCQTGGDYNSTDQVMRMPFEYKGGYELEMVRRLYDSGYPADGLTKLNAGPVYFGLGNHDVQSDYTPVVGWFKGCVRWSTPTDYWRWQMWNFICQKHRGVFTNCIFNWNSTPTSLPNAMDAKDPWSNTVFYWTERSLSYMVDLGPVDVYQLHVYGGDTNDGLASNFPFLASTLLSRAMTLGFDRPVIIVQHYDFTSFSIPDWWTPEQRDALLALLEPYNVIAFLMGHDHDMLNPIPFRQPYPNGSTKVADEFRPGSAGTQGNFALVRVDAHSLNIIQASGAGGTLSWSYGFHKTW